MMCKNYQAECSGFQQLLDDLEKKKKKTIEGDWGEPGNDSSTIKSDFSLELKYGEWMNSRTDFDLVRLCPYYRKFGVGLLVRCY